LTDLGLYFYKNSVNKAELFYKTGIEESKLSLMSNDEKTLLYADEFYLIAKAIGGDLTVMIEEVLGKYELGPTEIKTSNKVTDFGKYVELFLNTKKDLARKTNILQSRFSKLINDPAKRPYAHEVYLIAKSTGKKPADLFIHLFGHLELNSLDKQQELRAKKKM